MNGMTDGQTFARLQQEWDHIKEYIQREYDLSSISYKTWIQPLTVESVEGNTVHILIHSNHNNMLDYISGRYTKFFEVAITELLNSNPATGEYLDGPDYHVVFLLETEEQLRREEERQNGNADNSQEPSGKEDSIYLESNLNPRYRFDTFIVGGNNKFAQSACLAVAESPGQAYNPLFIYGGAGLGKTHLMHSIGHYVLEHDHNKKVLYVTSEQFTNEVIESIRSRNASSMSRLRDKYRTVDVLLIDDIQFIIGKESTQEEFFHTFNELHAAGKQIILSSDRPPKEMETLEERFRSRFEWGLIADIQPPDYETRMAILQKNTENQHIEIDPAILEYIATNIKSNIRELEGAYNKMIAYSKLNNVEINLENAREALKDIIYPDNSTVATPEMIVNTVCEHYGVRESDVTSRKRSSEYVVPRQVVMYILREHTDLTLDRIGKMLGNKDHTTVMHGADKIKEDLKGNEELKNNIELILRKLNLISG
ncbi:chromosomal replication initiator protein DnaA [Lachnoclostridium sp. Marseille-P6806]|uniref:chromosomal replication initiator protein DnaA n=1 Tax=Lachnoclostridium sp. Marseille-P6806 TaxID=2364793 RepID=UPI001F5F4F1E|nr:chromosomal replication initiator protein DnaA [Lachnoclostridium sp. Marseille-P6806]